MNSVMNLGRYNYLPPPNNASTPALIAIREDPGKERAPPVDGDAIERGVRSSGFELPFWARRAAL